MARTTIASLQAEIEDLKRLLTAKPSTTTEASAHYKAKDIACNAAKPCVKTFRTVKGRDWHVANSH